MSASSSSEQPVLAQGAEARVLVGQLGGKDCIIKERFSKAYRHPVLDVRLTDRRVGLEARMLARARKAGLDTPTVYAVDTKSKRIYMEHVHGVSVKQFIRQWNRDRDTGELGQLMAAIGRSVALLHDEGIIHGDLTTSNILLRRVDHSAQEQDGELPRTASVSSDTTDEILVAVDRVCVIDFGLSFGPALSEDKAVDLYVLERAFISTHPKSEDLFAEVLRAYQIQSSLGSQTLKRLNQVRTRGRKKLAFG